MMDDGPFGGSKERSASDNSAIFGYRGVLGHGTPIAGWMNGLFPWKSPIFKSTYRIHGAGIYMLT